MKYFVVAFPITIFLVTLFSGCHRFPDEMPIRDAVDEKACDVTVQGKDVSNMSFRVQSQNKITIVIPAGTILKSNSSGTQDMITASTVRIIFAGSKKERSNKRQRKNFFHVM